MAAHPAAALSYGRWTIADISSASPLRRRRHLEDLLSTGDRDESSYNSLLHQLEHTCTILNRRNHGSSACMAAHSPHRHAFGTGTFDGGLRHSVGECVASRCIIRTSSSRNERIRITSVALHPLMIDSDRGAALGYTLTSDKSATQSHVLPGAMVSEAEGECLEYSLNEGALMRQFPDFHGTEHISNVTEDYLGTKNVAQKSRYERQSRRAMSHWI